MTETQPLVRGQQLMLQRLMAAHVLTDDQAKVLYEELSPEMKGACSSLENCFGQINTQLTKSFGLEIATVSMAIGDKKQQKYHAVINCHADEVAKKSFHFSCTTHDRAFIRLILTHLVESNSAQRSDLINLRSDLPEPYKLTMAAAEYCIETLLEEKWLVLDVEEGGRRESMKATIQIAPRSYLELSHLLTDLGFPQEDLPQFIAHRA
jgi:hypothetical protein